MERLRRLWRRFMALPPLSRASIVIGVIAVGLLVAVLRPRPPEQPSRALAVSTTNALPTVSAPVAVWTPPPTASAPTEQRGGLKFKSALDRASMLALLNAAGPFQWTEREGHYRGEYLSASVPPDARVRIFSLGPGSYLADIKVAAARAGGPIDYARVEALVREKVLPVIEATDVEIGASYD